MKHACAGLLALLVVGCVASYKLTVTGTATVAKPPTCDFQVASLPPGPGFEEIATLSPSSEALSGDPEAFKARVRADVCRVGGDLVVTEVNGRGRYVRGIVMRKVSAEAPPAAAPPAPGA